MKTIFRSIFKLKTLLLFSGVLLSMNLLLLESSAQVEGALDVPNNEGSFGSIGTVESKDSESEAIDSTAGSIHISPKFLSVPVSKTNQILTLRKIKNLPTKANYAQSFLEKLLESSENSDTEYWTSALLNVGEVAISGREKQLVDVLVGEDASKSKKISAYLVRVGSDGTSLVSFLLKVLPGSSAYIHQTIEKLLISIGPGAERSLRDFIAVADQSENSVLVGLRILKSYGLAARESGSAVELILERDSNELRSAACNTLKEILDSEQRSKLVQILLGKEGAEYQKCAVRLMDPSSDTYSMEQLELVLDKISDPQDEIWMKARQILHRPDNLQMVSDQVIEKFSKSDSVVKARILPLLCDLKQKAIQLGIGMLKKGRDASVMEISSATEIFIRNKSLLDSDAKKSLYSWIENAVKDTTTDLSSVTEASTDPLLATGVVSALVKITPGEDTSYRLIFECLSVLTDKLKILPDKLREHSFYSELKSALAGIDPSVEEKLLDSISEYANSSSVSSLDNPSTNDDTKYHQAILALDALATLKSLKIDTFSKLAEIAEDCIDKESFVSELLSTYRIMVSNVAKQKVDMDKDQLQELITLLGSHQESDLFNSVNENKAVGVLTLTQSSRQLEQSIEQLHLDEVVASDLKSKKVTDKWAAIISIDSYDSVGLSDLKFLENDAKRFRSYLTDKAKFKQSNIIYNSANESLSDVATIFSQLSKKVKKTDLLVIYLSGHGLKLGRSNYLLCKSTDLGSVISTAFRIQNIFDLIIDKKLNCKYLLVIVDTCHSGGISASQNGGFENFADGYKNALGDTNILMLSSCGANQISTTTRTGMNSVFSYYLVDGLKKSLDIKSGFEWTIGKVYQDLNSRNDGRNWIQVPEVLSEYSNWDGKNFSLGLSPIGIRSN